MPTPNVETKVQCSHGHSHTVIEQADANTCGSKALRMALIEMGKSGSSPDADSILGYVGMVRGKGGWSGKQLVSAFALVEELNLKNGAKLVFVPKGKTFGDELREGNLQTSPVIAYCSALKGGSAAGGHWVAIVRRNKHFRKTSSFCVLDSATGSVQDVVIPKATGIGQFSFTNTDKNNVTTSWTVVIDGGGYRIK